jgi:hypothetical protein
MKVEGFMGPFSYQLAKEGLEVRIGKWPVRQIKYSDIDSVREGMSFINEHWTNILPFRFITVVRKTGLIKNFVVNPPDRESFIQELRTKIK